MTTFFYLSVVFLSFLSSHLRLSRTSLDRPQVSTVSAPLFCLNSPTWHQHPQLPTILRKLPSILNSQSSTVLRSQNSSGLLSPPLPLCPFFFSSTHPRPYRTFCIAASAAEVVSTLPCFFSSLFLSYPCLAAIAKVECHFLCGAIFNFIFLFIFSGNADNKCDTVLPYYSCATNSVPSTARYGTSKPKRL